MKPQVLVYRLGSLGDTLLALPVFYRIRAAFPTAEITLLTNAPVEQKAPPAEAILRDTGTVDRYLKYPVGVRNASALLSLAKTIRDGQFTICFNIAAARGFIPSCRDYMFFKAGCGIQRIIGTPFRKNDLHCRQTGSGLYEWEAQRLVRRIQFYGMLSLEDNVSWDLRLTDTEIHTANSLLSEVGIQKPFIVVSMGTKAEEKDWGEANWINMLGLAADGNADFGLVFVGADDDRARAERAAKVWMGPTANLCGRTEPRVCGAILSRASVFVGHDSGPMHLAAVMGTHVIAIFSHHNPPGQWFPRPGNHDIFYPDGYVLGPNPRAILSIRSSDAAAALRRKLRPSLLAK